MPGDLLDLDDLDALAGGPGRDRALDRLDDASAMAASRPPAPGWKTRSTSPLTEAIAAPIAFATSEWSGRRTSLVPGRSSGTSGAPPPTATSGTASREVFTRSIASASIASERAIAAARSGPC